MAMVKRYKGLNTDLDTFYSAIVNELQNTKDLNIVRELEGTVEGKKIRSVMAAQESIPRMFVGALREVTVTITGEPDDFVLEVHSGSWFSNLLMPGAGGLLIAGPIGGAAAAGGATLVAVDYQRKLSNRIRELVNEHSQKDLKYENVEHL